jgi:hypothetical protein
MSWKVIATSLNLRSEPRATPTNRIAVLPNGQMVEKEAEAAAGWWKITTVLGGARLEGYVAREYLAEERRAPEAPVRSGITPVHLKENQRTVTRDVTTGRAFPLGEADRPKRSSTAAAGKRVEQLRAIIDWLDVERKARYSPTTNATYCNIYAYDYCYLSGVYLPRVWWTARAISDLSAGRSVPVQYDSTVREVNANSLYNWLQDYGAEFGWRRTASPDEVQDAANQGKVAVICAQRVDLNRSGHIAAIAPETPPKHSAARKSGKVNLPLQSQAGVRNSCLSCGTTRWWADAKFRAFGFWIHD